MPMLAASELWSGDRVAWEWRSLEDFGDQPAHAIAGTFDLLVIDHPSIGEAIAARAIVPVDERIPLSDLVAIREDALGPNIAAYERAGRLWALPVDAASQVAAWREGSIDRPPTSWDEVVALARNGKACLALHPAQAICSFGSLCAMRGAPLGTSTDRSRWISAYDDLRAVAQQGSGEQFGWQQPDVLRRLVNGDFAYTPLVFGFASYEGDGIRFGPPPAPPGLPSIGTLGGAGVALTPTASDDAAAFASWIASPDVQREVVLASGGQPAGRRAWDFATEDAAGASFYGAVRASLESAWVRPTAAWWPDFQREGGERLVASLRRGDDAVVAIDSLSKVLPERGRATS